MMGKYQMIYSIAFRQCVLAMELEDIDMKSFDTLLVECQIHQYFPCQ